MVCTYFTAQSTVILLMVLKLKQSTRSSRNLGVGPVGKITWDSISDIIFKDFFILNEI